MLDRFEAIRGHSLKAGDEDVGKVVDLLFDDQSSDVRYVVCDTGGWLSTNEVLISPKAITTIDHTEGCLRSNLTKDQIERSPPISSDRPVSRQEEARLHEYYAWEPYWSAPMAGGPYFWAAEPMLHAGPTGVPTPLDPEERAAGDEIRDIERHRDATSDTHLRSAHEVIGYHILANDGKDVGKVKDLYFSPDAWHFRFILIDTGSFFSGKKIAIATDWLEAVDWAERVITLDLAGKQIESSPPIKDEALSDEDERRLADAYGRSLP